MQVYMNAQGNHVLRLGKSQSQRYPALERQFSSLSASTSRSDPVATSPVHSSQRSPVYTPVYGRSKLDDHFIKHKTKGSKNCYYCKKDYLDPKLLNQDRQTSTPALNKNFETYQHKIEHTGQHTDCAECQNLVVPLIKMMDYPLPRSGKDKKIEIPSRYLGSGNHNPKFQNNLVADLDFI